MQTLLRPHYFLTLLLLVCSFLFSMAQKDEKDKKKKKKNFDPTEAVLIAPVYTAQFPFGNMKDRFGFNSLFGAQISYKTGKNWLVGAEGNFLYGTNVKDNYVLDHISNYNGQFISQNNTTAGVRLQEQGGTLKFNFGKIFPVSQKYPDAGIMIMTGVGFIQHKIGINVRASSYPQLGSTYRKGYDRMSNGPIFSQFVGGVFMARRKFISGYAGIQFDFAYTQGRRPYDFYQMQPLHDKRYDMFLGIRIGWIIPVFLHTSQKEHFYYQ